MQRGNLLSSAETFWTLPEFKKQCFNQDVTILDEFFKEIVNFTDKIA